MQAITNTRIQYLYSIVKDADEPMINDEQRTAIGMLGESAQAGDENAWNALKDLFRAPFLHPLLREMIAAELQIPLRKPVPQ